MARKPLPPFMANAIKKFPYFLLTDSQRVTWIAFAILAMLFYTLAKFQVFILKSPQIETELNADSNNAG